MIGERGERGTWHSMGFWSGGQLDLPATLAQLPADDMYAARVVSEQLWPGELHHATEAGRWFVWDGRALWINSVVKSQRWTNIVRDPRASVVVDGGHDFGELRGVELIGSFEPVGEAPRTSAPDEVLAEPERLFAEKYSGGGAFHADGRHAWLRMVPTKVVSWDFRKMGG